MFTGIIEQTGKIHSIQPFKGGLEISVESDLSKALDIDDSIAVNGVCQTVIKKTDRTFTVQAVEETLRKTTFGNLEKGAIVNLERSLTPQSRLDGHIVQGHVDTTGTIGAIENEGANWLIEIEYPRAYETLVVGRGSVAIEGISLTVARERKGAFMVAIIPYTWQFTNLNKRSVGDKVNLEFDILGKYVTKFLSSSTSSSDTSPITERWLRDRL